MTTIAEYRTAVAAFLERQPSTVSLSLAWNDPQVSMDCVRSALSLIHQMVDRQIYGPRYARRCRADRSRFWAVVELLDRHPHCHLGWQLPPDGPAVLDTLLSEGVWKDIAPAGSHDLKIYRPGWAGYATKCLPKSTENLIFSDDFLSNK